MPKYRNDTTQTYLIQIYSNGRFVRDKDIAPGDIVETEKIITIPGFTLLDDAPYYNPITGVNPITFAAAETHEVVVPDIKHTETAQIWKVEGANVTVYLRSTSNTPEVAILRPGDSAEISLHQSVDKVILVSDDAGSCEIVFKKE